jgi:hypothetical protein
MSYEAALRAAGADILAFEAFGSYQGEWWAKVVYQNQQGWVQGEYGSCSGCDAFEAEFGPFEPTCEQHDYTGFDPTCPACVAAQAEYLQRLAQFGQTYLDSLLTQEEAERMAARTADFGVDDAQVLEFLREHRLQAH